MRWQRLAQAAIAIFVIGFIVVLVTTLRRETAIPTEKPPPPPREKQDALIENPGGCEQIQSAGGRRIFTLRCGKHFLFKDGRQRLTDGVEVRLPRGEREFVIRSSEADILPQDTGIAQAVFTGDVRVTSESGLDVKAAEATYSDADGMLKIPGQVEFARGRMSGSGVNATYDRNREVLWILEKARIAVGPNAKTGQAGAEGTAVSIGVARADHFVRLVRDARLTAEGRVLQADEIVIRLAPDEERIQAMELRGNSRITGGAGGPQSMTARDIDLSYAEDGRTLQQARLVENAVLQMAGAGAGGKRIAGRTIDLTLAPNGTDVTNLTANEAVQVDLPAEGAAPAKQIRSTELRAGGAPGAGLQQATFTGRVEYVERRGRQAKTVSDRTARADSLVVDTKPGLGAIERADFRGHVKFTEAPDLTAEAPQGIYILDKDRLQLMPGEGLPGSPPLVSDGRMSVSARTIDVTLSTREMTADTRVRSTLLPGKPGATTGGKVPSMLAEDKPVNVTANRLKYSGRGARAEYSGNATLWQEPDTQIRADTIAIDDKTGNLTATGSVVTELVIQESDRKTGARTPTRTRGTAEAFSYDEGRRLATYTEKATLTGAQGDIRGTRIELFLKPAADELERAEAYGPGVVVKEGSRMASGTHLTYTAADDRYLLVGTPVEIVEERKGSCTRTLGASATFNRTTEAASVEGNARTPMEAKTLPACPPELKR